VTDSSGRRAYSKSHVHSRHEHYLFQFDVYIMARVRGSDLHRVYIQSLMSRRAMRENVAMEMYKRAIGAVTGQSSFSILPSYTSISVLRLAKTV
jgi:hypothetical protein